MSIHFFENNLLFFESFWYWLDGIPLFPSLVSWCSVFVQLSWNPFIVHVDEHYGVWIHSIFVSTCVSFKANSDSCWTHLFCEVASSEASCLLTVASTSCTMDASLTAFCFSTGFDCVAAEDWRRNGSWRSSSAKSVVFCRFASGNEGEQPFDGLI